MNAPSASHEGGEASELARRSTAGSRLGLWLALGALLYALVPRGFGALFLLAYNAGLAGLFLLDRARLQASRLQVKRAPLLRWFAHQDLDYMLELALADTSGPARRLRLTVAESAPLGFLVEPTQQRAEVSDIESSQLALKLHATRHGSARMTHVFVRRESVLGLCAVIEAHACASALRAYPRLPLGSPPWPALALTAPGVTPKPRHSAEQGGEIERLREYAPTDPMRSIDWKASAKRRRPITRSYQPERSQTLWIVLDASRVMMAPSEEAARGTRFESALEAALVLASAALAQGDQVGFMVYGRALRLSLPPKRGRAHLFTIIDALLSVHPEPCELDAQGLLRAFAEAAPKRSLFVLFTDLDNGTDLELLAEHAALITRRHLALCVSLSGQNIEQRLHAPIENERDAYRRVAAVQLKDERESLKRNLRGAGLHVIESALPGLPRVALAEYQRQKRAGRL